MKKMFALPLGMLLLCMMMIGNAFADKPKNQQILPPADATQADSTATADFQEMPVLDLRSPIDFMNDETAGASSIAVDPPGAVLNVVSVPNFSGSFVFNGTTFPFTIMGNDPSQGHKTNIPAKIVSVDVQLLNADGTVFANVPVAPFENLTLNFVECAASQVRLHQCSCDSRENKRCIKTWLPSPPGRLNYWRYFLNRTTDFDRPAKTMSGGWVTDTLIALPLAGALLVWLFPWNRLFATGVRWRPDFAPRGPTSARSRRATSTR